MSTQKLPTYDLFISHSSKDKPFVVKLAEDLKRAGFSVWLDQWELTPGDSISEAISDAITKSRFLLIVMSPDYFNSPWTLIEYMAAMDKELDERHVKAVPILYRECDIPLLLSGKLWIDFRDPKEYQASFLQLV